MCETDAACSVLLQTTSFYFAKKGQTELSAALSVSVPDVNCYLLDWW